MKPSSPPPAHHPPCSCLYDFVEFAAGWRGSSVNDYFSTVTRPWDCASTRPTMLGTHGAWHADDIDERVRARATDRHRACVRSSFDLDILWILTLRLSLSCQAAAAAPRATGEASAEAATQRLCSLRLLPQRWRLSLRHRAQALGLLGQGHWLRVSCLRARARAPPRVACDERGCQTRVRSPVFVAASAAEAPRLPLCACPPCPVSSDACTIQPPSRLPLRRWLLRRLHRRR